VEVFDPVAHAKQKERILKIALHLFATQGFVETSMLQIAKASKLQKATLYHYFLSKDQILKSLVQWRWEQIKQRIQTPPAGKNLEAMLLGVARDFLKDMREPAKQEFILLMYRQGLSSAAMRKIFVDVFQNNYRQAQCQEYHKLYPETRVLSQREFFLCVYQFIGALMRYAIETKLWKAGAGMMFSEKEYINNLAKVFAKGMGAR
jgi:AcrR family transcriptional regulator